MSTAFSCPVLSNILCYFSQIYMRLIFFCGFLDLMRQFFSFYLQWFNFNSVAGRFQIMSNIFIYFYFYLMSLIILDPKPRLWLVKLQRCQYHLFYHALLAFSASLTLRTVVVEITARPVNCYLLCITASLITMRSRVCFPVLRTWKY